MTAIDVTTIDTTATDPVVIELATRGEAAASIERQLSALRQLQAEHPFWRCALMTAFADGVLSPDDLRYIFSQYHLYSSSFTRFIAAVMANCDNDLFRAQLSENLWEEGGGCEPERRHAQIFRRFLRDGLGVNDLASIGYGPATRQFVRDYLDYAMTAGAVAGAAFLSLGTEGVVARMYTTMRGGLVKAGIAEADLEFFDIHIACDDEHAVTLENMMMSYADQPGWFEVCAAAVDHALNLRMAFFDHLFNSLQRRRIEPMLERMQRRVSLAQNLADAALCHRPGGSTVAMYANEVAKLNVQFTVERLPLSAEVMDPRMVRIPPGKFNEKHKHAHETLIHILAGEGQVLIDDRVLPVRTGDTVLVPRWALHQTQNLGGGEMQFLAVTDFQLSQRAFLGDATDYRMHADVDARDARRRNA